MSERPISLFWTRRTFLWASFLALNSVGVRPLLGDISTGPATLDLKVYDSATGQVVPCSVAIWTSSGELLTQNAGYSAGIRSTGEFHSDLPLGKTRVIVTRGFDYQSEVREFQLEPGKTTACEIHLARVSSLHKDGWVSGDNHVHMRHGDGKIIVDFAFVELTARAEGLDYMSVAQQWNVPDPTPELLSHKCAEVSAPDCTLHWNMEEPKNYWKGDVSHCMGHCWNLGMRDMGPGGSDPIVELFAMSAGDYQIEKVPTPNFESHAYIHSAGGIVAYTHTCRIWRGEWGGKSGFPIEADKYVSNMAQELPFDTVAGPTYDCIDITMQTRERLVNELGQQLWFMLLNHGYRIPGTASTDASFDNPGSATPGEVRVYTQIDGVLTLDKVAKSMKSGRNFVTSGPLLTFTMGEHGIGDVIPVSSPIKFRARVQAWASGVPEEYLTRIEVIRNGEVYKIFELDGKFKTHEINFVIEEGMTSWYIVKCYGSQPSQYAISNPIYFESSDYQPPQPAKATVKINVVKSGSGEPLDGTYEVVEMIGRVPRVQNKGTVRGGSATIVAPPTARIRISVDGFNSEMKSIFMDTPELLNLTTELQLSQIIDWSTYETIRKSLSEIKLDFEMRAAK
jgi:hypothetical protein